MRRRDLDVEEVGNVTIVPPGTLAQSHHPSHAYESVGPLHHHVRSLPCACPPLRSPGFKKQISYIQKQFLPKVVSLCAAQDDSGDGEGSAESSASGGLPLHRDHESLKLVVSN